MNNKFWLVAVFLSALLTVVVAVLTSIAANYLSPIPFFENNPWIVYVTLIVVFFLSLPLNVYLARHTLSNNNPLSGDELPVLPDQRQQPSTGIVPAQYSKHLPGKSYRELVGRDSFVGDVITALRDPAGKWVVTIDGMGGIGKTALAREVASRCLEQRLFDLVIWEQAPKERSTRRARRKEVGTFTFETALDAIARELGALDIPRLKSPEKESRVRHLLQSQRVLVVLDNLETSKEPQNEIARKLRPLLGPSKALLTSRHRFKGDLYPVSLDGLTLDDSSVLLRRIADERNIGRIATAQASELREIAEVTGGSPLALKLVAGQLTHLPLANVLGPLREIQVPTQDSDEDDYYRFYKDIFFPSWRLLSEEGRQLLISMSHFAPGIGGTTDAVGAASGLDSEQLTPTIDELWRLSFLEVGESPSLNQVRYYLHALTQYFVLSDIVKALD